MATNFSPCKGSYVLNQFPSNVMFGMNGFHVSASGAIQGHHGPLVRYTPYLGSAQWVAMETMHFHIAQTNIFLGTNFFCIWGVPMNTMTPMKNCPGGGGLQGR